LAYEAFFYALFALLIIDRRLGGCAMAVWLGLILTQYRSEDFPLELLRESLPPAFSGRHGRGRCRAALAGAGPKGRGRAGSDRFSRDRSSGRLSKDPSKSTQRAAGYTVGSALVVAGLVQAERACRLPVPRGLGFLGDASYAIYLVHFPALSLLSKVAKLLHLEAVLPETVLFRLAAGGALARVVSSMSGWSGPIIGGQTASLGQDAEHQPAAPRALQKSRVSHADRVMVRCPP